MAVAAGVAHWHRSPREGASNLLRLNGIVGHLDDPALERRVHALAHAGAVETVEVEAGDLPRRRLRLRSDRGTEVALALPRDLELRDGAVLHLADDAALVLRVRPRHWITLQPRDAEAALQLGFLAGHLHWRVAFDGARLRVAPEAGTEECMARIADRLPAGAVRLVGEETAAPAGGRG